MLEANKTKRGRQERHRGRLAATAIAAGIAATLCLAANAPAWDVCVSAGNPSPQVYGKGTQADPYVVCEGTQLQITFTAQTCYDADGTGECEPTGVTYTWSPQPGSGTTETVKLGPYTSAGLHTYTATATGKAAGFIMPNGSPCKNPPPSTKSGSDTVYIVSSSGTAWTPVSSPKPTFPAPPTVPDQIISGSGYCPAPDIYDYQVKYVSSVQPDIVNGSSQYSGCGAAVTSSKTITTQCPYTVTVSFGPQAGPASGAVSIPVSFGNVTQTYTSTFTAGPKSTLDFEIMRRTPAWYLSVSAYYRSTACFQFNSGPYGPWQYESTVASPDFTELPGSVWDVWAQCCGG
jgi:hypothetical protein